MSGRILYGGLFHETHTFLEETTDWHDFEVVRGEAVLAKQGDCSPLGGFLTAAQELSFEVIPTLDVRATPSGTVADKVFDRFWTEFEPVAREALATGVDAIFLVMHGAMATASQPDVEGDLLGRIRQLPGAAEVPIFGVFDLHANFSCRMGQLANGLLAYRENPHTDARESAIRAVHLMNKALKQGEIPHMLTCRIPMVWAPPATGTSDKPMRALRLAVDEIVESDPTVWAGNVVPGFSFADTPDTGFSLSVIYTGDSAGPADRLRAVAGLAWAKREEGLVSYPPVGDVLQQRSTDISGPVLLVEPSDNIGGGAPGDGTGVLRALLAHDVGDALVAINDPAAVRVLAAHWIGETTNLNIGGKGSPLDEGPVPLEVTLVSRSEGTFELEDPHSHLASMLGSRVEMGPCAVVRTGGITILLTSRKTPPFDLGQYRSQGIEPADFVVIGVKAAVAHRRAYDPIAGASFGVDTPGPCRSDVTAFPWRCLRRPAWPLDHISEPTFLIS